jgi:ubiquitin-activating enzyme E1
VEVAKNIILAGVKSVTLYDPLPVTYNDLSSQFYLSEGDLGRPRADASVHRLMELNQYVPVHVEHGHLDDALLSRSAPTHLHR